MSTKTDSAAHTARLDALEEKAAYQDRLIEELNAALLEHWKSLAAAEARLLRLEQRLTELQNRAVGQPEDEPPPPHY